MREIKMLAKSISHARPTTFTDFIGQNPVIRESITFAQKIAKIDSIVSIRGESGTGKEVFARAIHTASGRSGPFIPVNCAALPETLLESELFGYVGGAFTGAKKEGKPGLFELASGGTIFLDEISDMPFSVQAKILRVIQEKCVRSIGGSKENPIDCRILTSTNENLEQMVKDKLFREDLYYRISVLPIHISPLRERIDDIPLLVDHFLFQLDCKLDRTPQTVTEDAMEKLCQYNWPGNVRELKNVIERAAILCESDRIDTDCILFNFEIGRGNGELRSHFLCPREGRSLQATLDHYEKQILSKTLEGSESIRKAAKSLGMSHTALLNKVKKHRINMERK
ncbi:MAG: sigma 54-interacting transcriptional regulator [Syntrophobacteraceae bacterium]|nr:sigma 54-interacting transcriptional regulator [Syntrophobacteraceae bacterium]